MTDTIKHTPTPNKFYEAEVIISDLSDKNNEQIIERGSFYSGELITLDSIVNKTNSHDALVAALKRAKAVMKPKTIREIIQSGDDCISASGLNPYCMNEGLASGDEDFDCDFIDEALKQAGAE